MDRSSGAPAKVHLPNSGEFGYCVVVSFTRPLRVTHAVRALLSARATLRPAVLGLRAVPVRVVAGLCHRARRERATTRLERRDAELFARHGAGRRGDCVPHAALERTRVRAAGAWLRRDDARRDRRWRGLSLREHASAASIPSISTRSPFGWSPAVWSALGRTL